MIDGLKPCPFCGSTPHTTDFWESGHLLMKRLECSCGVTTSWFDAVTYDRERFVQEGPASPGFGAYYDVDWKNNLRSFWNTRRVG